MAYHVEILLLDGSFLHSVIHIRVVVYGIAW